MSTQVTIPRQAWGRIFGKKDGVPAQYRTSLVRAGAFTILGGLIIMFSAANVESTYGTARYYRTNTYDYMAIRKDARSAMETSVMPAGLMSELQNTQGIRADGVTNYFGKLETRDVLFAMYRPGSSMKPLLARGRHLQTNNETVIDKDLAKGLGISLGDNVKLIGKTYRVVGLSRQTGSFGKELVFISEPAMFGLYQGDELYNSIAITTHGKPLDPQLVKKWSSQVDFITKSEYVDGNIKYWIRNISPLVMTLIGAVTILGLLGVAVIVAKQVELLMHHYGLMRAIGTSRLQLAGLEALIMTILMLIGWILAIPLGMVLIQAMNSMTPGFHASLSATDLITSIICLVPIGVVAIWRLWRKVGKVTPMDQIREG